MIRIQLAPDIEFKMDVEIPEIDESTRNHDVQQYKTQILEEFNKRLAKAFPEGYKLHAVEFGRDTGWHEELKLPGDDSPVVT